MYILPTRSAPLRHISCLHAALRQNNTFGARRFVLMLRTRVESPSNQIRGSQYYKRLNQLNNNLVSWRTSHTQYSPTNSQFVSGRFTAPYASPVQLCPGQSEHPGASTSCSMTCPALVVTVPFRKQYHGHAAGWRASRAGTAFAVASHAASAQESAARKGVFIFVGR